MLGYNYLFSFSINWIDSLFFQSIIESNHTNCKFIKYKYYVILYMLHAKVRTISYYDGHVILRKFENFIDFQFTQLFIQTKKDLSMKLWGMIENMLMNVSKVFIVVINKKISMMVKSESVKTYVTLRLGAPSLPNCSSNIRNISGR